MANMKFKATYLCECSNLSDKIGRVCSMFIAFASTSSVAAWAIWDKLPILWAGIVVVSQLANIAKPYFPFIKYNKEYLQMSFDFSYLYLEYERLWMNYENNRMSEEDAEKAFHALREKEIEIEKAYDIGICPKIQRLITRAAQETETSLALNFS